MALQGSRCSDLHTVLQEAGSCCRVEHRKQKQRAGALLCGWLSSFQEPLNSVPRPYPSALFRTLGIALPLCLKALICAVGLQNRRAQVSAMVWMWTDCVPFFVES